MREEMTWYSEDKINILLIFSHKELDPHWAESRERYNCCCTNKHMVLLRKIQKREKVSYWVEVYAGGTAAQSSCWEEKRKPL